MMGRMAAEKRFPLRSGAETWAVIVVSGEHKRFEHSLNDAQLASAPPLTLHDEDGQPPALSQSQGHLEFYDAKGVCLLNLRIGGNLNVIDLDTKGNMRLYVRLEEADPSGRVLSIRRNQPASPA